LYLIKVIWLNAKKVADGVLNFRSGDVYFRCLIEATKLYLILQSDIKKINLDFFTLHLIFSGVEVIIWSSIKYMCDFKKLTVSISLGNAQYFLNYTG